MSIKVMTAVWQNAPPMKPARLLMLLALADNCSDEGMCYPSMKHLAHKTRQSERNAQYCLRYLEQHGLIARAVDESNFTRYFVNLDILHPPGAKFAPPPGAKFDITPDKFCTTLVQNPAKVGVFSFIEPSLEPSVKKPSNTLHQQRALMVREIYELYPRKIGKKAALRAIEKAIQDLMKSESYSLERAVACLKERTKQFAESAAGQKGSLTPHPATWFNRGSYTDNPEEWNAEEKKHGETRAQRLDGVFKELFDEDDETVDGDISELPPR